MTLIKTAAARNLPISEYPGGIDNTGFWYVFPTVYGKTKEGRKTQWTIMVGLYDIHKNKMVKIINDQDISDEEYYGVIRTDFSFVGGKVRDEPFTYVKKGKNLGRANETNPYTQAMKDAYSKYVSATEKDGETEFVRPMLARELKENPITDWPIYMQCKFNGNRVMFGVKNKTIYPYSRNLKPVSVEDRLMLAIKKVYKLAKQVFDGLTDAEMETYGLEKRPTIPELFLDGEMYAHGSSLQKLGKLRGKKAVADNAMKYYLFDVFISSSPDVEYQFRYMIIKKIRDIYDGDDVVFVKTYLAKNMEEITQRYERFVAMGYEGAMIRLPNMPYDPSIKSRHSRYLLKMKPRFEEEYEVIGFAGGDSSGKEEGAILIIVDVDGHELTLQPALPLEERKALYEKYSKSARTFKEELNGKMIKVYFDEKSDDGIPLRAKTKLEIRGVE